MNDRVAALQADNEALEDRVEETAGVLTAAERARFLLEQRLVRAGSEIEALGGRNADLQEALEASQEVSARFQAKVKALTAEQDALADRLAALRRRQREAFQTEAAETKDQLEAAQTTVAELAAGLSHAGQRLLEASQQASTRFQPRVGAPPAARHEVLADE